MIVKDFFMNMKLWKVDYNDNIMYANILEAFLKSANTCKLDMLSGHNVCLLSYLSFLNPSIELQALQ